MVKTEEILVEWARKNPLIKRIYLYGSRTTDTHKGNSDLDVAVEIYRSNNDSNVLATWLHNKDGWTNELQSLLPYKLHLEWFGGEETPTIEKALRGGGRLIYGPPQQLPEE
jgi:predicted nucleotidyltransferase